MITFWGILVVLGVLVVARYGDGGSAEAYEADPADLTDPAGPGPARAAFARRLAAQRQLAERFDRSLRPWESAERPGVTR